MIRKPYQSQAAYEGQGIVLMARVVDADGNNLTQDDIASIQIKVIDLSDKSPVATVNPSKADVIFDTLQTSSNSAWSADDTGCNFIYKTLAAHLPDGGKKYQFEVSITPTSGEVIPFAFRVPTVELYGTA